MVSISLGSIIYAAVKPIFKIYIIIGVGYYLAKRNILNVKTCRDISDLVVSALMPSLIFYNIIYNLKSSDIKNLGIIFFTGTLLYIVGVSLAFAVYIITGSPKRWLGGLLSVGLFPNISDLPIAYLQTLSQGGLLFTTQEGDKGVAYVCLFLASQVLYQFSLGLYQLIEWDFRDELKPKSSEEESVESNTEEGEEVEKDDSHESDEIIGANNQNFTSGIVRKFLSQEDADKTSICSSIASDDNAVSAVSHNVQTPDENRQHNEFLMAHVPKTEKSQFGRVPSTGSRRRSNSLTSASFSLNQVTSRTSALRHQKSQDINDVINEYSEFEGLRSGELRATTSGIGEVGVDLVDRTTTEESGLSKKTIKHQKLKQILKNFLKPNSISLISSIIIAMSPPLKSLFIASTVNIPNAPDGQPPLSFIMDTADYMGNASVPCGLLLLGACISRLNLKGMPKGFWKTAIAITLVRLVILPIFGVGLTTGLNKAGWYGDDKLIRFVSVLEFGLPNATALVYFTAFYTDPTSEDHLQMDCLAACLIFQYSILCISLPFLVTFSLKVSLGY